MKFRVSRPLLKLNTSRVKELLRENKRLQDLLDKTIENSEDLINRLEERIRDLQGVIREKNNIHIRLVLDHQALKQKMGMKKKGEF